MTKKEKIRKIKLMVLFLIFGYLSFKFGYLINNKSQIIEKEIEIIKEVEVEKIIYKNYCSKKECSAFIQECIGKFAYKAVTETPNYKVGTIFENECVYFKNFYCTYIKNESGEDIERICYPTEKIFNKKFFKPVK